MLFNYVINCLHDYIFKKVFYAYWFNYHFVQKFNVIVLKYRQKLACIEFTIKYYDLMINVYFVTPINDTQYTVLKYQIHFLIKQILISRALLYAKKKL